MQKKIKLLVLADSPTVATGFAVVSRNILNRLAKTGKYEIDIIGINFRGNPYDQEKFPYKIYPAQPQGQPDMFGRPLLYSALNGELTKEGLKQPWDLVFTIQDPFIIEGLGLGTPFAKRLRLLNDMWKRTLPPEYWFKWIGYFPVDSTLKENWVTDSVAMPNYPVAYCNWGKSEMLKHDRKEHTLKFKLKTTEESNPEESTLTIPSLAERVEVIPHGVDLNIFKPLEKKKVDKFKAKFFGKDFKDKFLIVNISRNQPRKDIARTLAVFKEFKKLVPKAHLYLHMQETDVGGSIFELGRQFGLEPNEDFSLPDNFNSSSGYTIDIVNMIYNCADVCLTTTLGEGWGFITTESMATKTPLIAPNITAIRDIFGCHVDMSELNQYLFEKGGWDKVRGIPVKAGSNTSEFTCLGLDDNERIRPVTNVDDMVQKLLWVYKNPKQVEKITDRAFEWVQDYTWEKIVDKWSALFDKAYADLEAERALVKEEKKVDPFKKEII